MSTVPPASPSLVDWFSEWSSAYRSAIPWPWPMSMTDDDLKFFRQVPGLTAERGAIINNRFVIWGELDGARGQFEFEMKPF